MQIWNMNTSHVSWCQDPGQRSPNCLGRASTLAPGLVCSTSMKLERFPAMVYRLALWTIHISRTSVMFDDSPSLASVMEEKFSARVESLYSSGRQIVEAGRVGSSRWAMTGGELVRVVEGYFISTLWVQNLQLMGQGDTPSMIFYRPVFSQI
ncbi:hypothetical protein DSO57_1030079 [Entomophthora muscae]|uniref:Uncharacterized protein n=1 Tax=Entomophthora muscae TaxID=34485 RepID=A0ACC2RRX8_9FUNG|nr:hypothetical protein DSO57_1030079 [Entomophthora muscae]